MMKYPRAPVEPMAASARILIPLPTIAESTMLYICWNSDDTSMGTEKRIIRLRGEPLVISIVCAMIFPPDSKLSVQKKGARRL